MPRRAAALLAFLLPACSVYTSELVDDEASDVAASGASTGGSVNLVGMSPSSKGGKATGSSGSSSASGNHTGAGGADSAGGTPPIQGGETVGGGAGTEATPSGGAGSGSSNAGTTGNGGGGVASPGDLLDGFEDEDLTLEQTGGRGGVWYLFDDGTVGKSGPAPLVCAPLSAAPAELGGFGMRITASGFTGWGSGLGVDFRAGKKPYDASNFSGLRFWAKVGSGKNTHHRIQIGDATTDKLGGKCNPAVDALDGEKCDDHFGVNQTFTTTWTQYTVLFSGLSQIGWGNSAAALDKRTLYSLQVTAKAKLDVELWLDQIEFF